LCNPPEWRSLTRSPGLQLRSLAVMQQGFVWSATSAGGVFPLIRIGSTGCGQTPAGLE
jgi:hypothetical protein